jgi:hypothetical protein
LLSALAAEAGVASNSGTSSKESNTAANPGFIAAAPASSELRGDCRLFKSMVSSPNSALSVSYVFRRQ